MKDSKFYTEENYQYHEYICPKCGEKHFSQIEDQYFPCDVWDMECRHCGLIISIAELYNYNNEIDISDVQKNRIKEIQDFNRKLHRVDEITDKAKENENV